MIYTRKNIDIIYRVIPCSFIESFAKSNIYSIVGKIIAAKKHVYDTPRSISIITHVVYIT